MPTPTAIVHSSSIEAARAAALASHSAAGLCAAAGSREAARLLRSSEALARAATAALLALPSLAARIPGSAEVDAEKQEKKKSRRKKKSKQTAKVSENKDAEVLPMANGIQEAVEATLAQAPAPVRVLAARSSRERSPRGFRKAPAAAPPSSSTSQVPVPAPVGADAFAVGQAVILVGLVSRADLLGKRAVIKSYDATSKRFAVLVDATNESVRVLGANLKASIFAAGTGFG
jgi:hypothetical protein